MSLSRSVRAFPVLLKIGFSEAVAYRAEMLVWTLSTTMPLIMLALWSAVAREAPVGRYGQPQFTAYFLVTFIVRQLTGSWASWQLSFEVRQGTLAMRLLRPMHPLWSYAAENLAAVPLRIVISLPVAAVLLALLGTRVLPHDPVLWIFWAAAMLGGWGVTFLVNVSVGTLSLYMESSLKVMDVYFALFMVFSGYLIPVELFPDSLKALVQWLPFRYQIGFPVELLTGTYDRAQAGMMLARQWAYVAVLGGVTSLLWTRGLKRFAAYGG